MLIVGFWKHGLHFFSLFVPHGTPLPMIPLIALIELVSFMVRPFSLGLRLFVAMMAGHVLLEVLSSFVIDGLNAGVGIGLLVGVPSFAADGRDLRAGNSRRRHPGLCFRAAFVALHQRRRTSSLSPYSQFRIFYPKMILQGVITMDAEAQS